MSVRVLIVDDTDHVRRMLGDILGLHGFDVVGEASNADEAVALSGELDPDVVVMDYMMPSVDGIEASRRILAARNGQNIIVYSAFVDPDLKRRAAEVGVAACVPKRAGIEALATEISAVAMDFGR